MSSLWPSLRRAALRHQPRHVRGILTLAIETSCDDTSVAIVETAGHAAAKNGQPSPRATLFFNSKITSDNRSWGGVHPVAALESHRKNLSGLVNQAMHFLPVQPSATAHVGNSVLVPEEHGSQLRKKPDFVTVTRGPGMYSNLATGLDTAKGLSVAWQVPLVAVNHMQAHALTPRLVSELETHGPLSDTPRDPEFPFLSMLVSGGHTMLVLSKSLCDHRILANTIDIAIGDSLDKCARDILPVDLVAGSKDVMYGRMLEEFAFPRGSEDYDYVAPVKRGQELDPFVNQLGWSIGRLLSQGERSNNVEFSYAGIGGVVKKIIARRSGQSSVNADMPIEERRALARDTMTVAFEHLASRTLLALKDPKLKDVSTVVVSGGVASNQYLHHIFRSLLDNRGFKHLRLIFPPPSLCTDNAAMIAWTGIEMWEAGYRSSLEVMPLKKWAIDPEAEDGGIPAADGWTISPSTAPECTT